MNKILCQKNIVRRYIYVIKRDHAGSSHVEELPIHCLRGSLDSF